MGPTQARRTPDARKRVTAGRSFFKCLVFSVFQVTARQGNPVSYSQVLALLDLDGLRRVVLDKFSVLGGDRNRWSRDDRGRMAEALTAGEDWLEMERPSRVRDGIRKVRRMFEVEAVR